MTRPTAITLSRFDELFKTIFLVVVVEIPHSLVSIFAAWILVNPPLDNVVV
jgi:hypothetical protein